MKLRISPMRRISEVQADFNEVYPYLKLEFLRNVLFQQPDKTRKDILPSHFRIAQAQRSKAEGYIDIFPEMKVRELEKKLCDDYSIRAQVFRKSGNVWLQTTMTDNWTLRQQNEHAQDISDDQQVEEKKEPTDFDLERQTD